MSEKLVDITDSNLVESGIVKSLHPLAAPLWRDGENVIFEDGQVRKSPGTQKIGTVIGTAPVTGIIDTLIDGKPNLVWGDFDSLYRVNQGAITVERTGYNAGDFLIAFQDGAFQEDAFQYARGRIASLWSLENWGEWVIATDGVNTPQIDKMDGSGAVDLTGSPPAYAQIVVRIKNYIVFFNTELGGNFAVWCDTDNVEDYVNGAAGNLPIRDLSSEIIAAERLGDVIGVYSVNEMIIFQYIGPPYYFGYSRAMSGIGAASKACVVEKEGKHYGVCKTGFWVTDGSSYQYISPPLLREWAEANIDWSNGSKIAGFLNEGRSLIEWGVPVVGGTGNNDITIAFNYEKATWTFRSYGLTAGLQKGIWEFPIIGMANGDVLYTEFGFDHAGAALVAFVQTKPFKVGEFLDTYSLDYVLAGLTSIVTTGVKVYLGVSDSVEADPVWTSPLVPNEALDPLFVDLLEKKDGRYVHFKIESTELGDNWRLSGFQIFGVKTGADV